MFADNRVNILAMSLDASGSFRAVTDNHLHATGLLRSRQYQVEERDVIYVLMPNEPGSLANITQLVANAGFNLDYAYAAAVEGHPLSSVVLGVPDAQRTAAAAGL